ncbi:MAG: glutamine amidotransferase [Rhodospirillales bacterium]|nr:glutamine amidotransferase [Rhodospirillales bacterium]
MCGIAGLIHRGKSSNIGAEMTAMLRALKHRGPDSTGFAVYGEPSQADYVMRFKVAEREDLESGIAIHQQVKDRRQAVDRRLAAIGASVTEAAEATEYALRYRFTFDGELTELARQMEDIEGVEILSIGRGLELIKDLGDADDVSGQYGLGSFSGTHAIGHTRMATESDVDIRSAHPYWAYPYSDISVVHNGQITNYWNKRRDLERCGHRFVSDCDSELLAVYTADKLEQGYSLEESLHRSAEEIDGVFTYFVATKDELGMAKDTMAAKPLVLFESDDVVAIASEEIAIRSIFPQEIDTFDPYDGEVRVWRA